ncbi:MAG: Rieske (2Fe-2S) protein [Candidatus Bathyarchaeia archaeon]
MPEYLDIGNVGEIRSGWMKRFIPREKPILVASVEEKLFAVSDTCPHRNCSLGQEGALEGYILTCGCHGAQFSVRSGEVLSGPAKEPLAVYETKVENGRVLVKI